VAYEHQQVIQAQAESLAAQRARALNEYEACRLSEDTDGTMAAADAIVDIDARAAALSRIACNLAASQQQRPQGNRYGLSRDEIEVAHGLASGDRKLTNEQREEAYARNKARYQQARRDGSYRDDQGRVTR